MSPPITRSDVLVERDFREPGDDLITGPAIIYKDFTFGKGFRILNFAIFKAWLSCP